MNNQLALKFSLELKHVKLKQYDSVICYYVDAYSNDVYHCFLHSCAGLKCLKSLKNKIEVF